MTATQTDPVPEHTRLQRLAALESANRIRVFRAQKKRQLKSGETSLVDLLVVVPLEMQTMRVMDLLLASPKVGRVKASKVLVQCSLPPSKTIGGLTTRQRSWLLELLRAAR